MRTLLLPFLLSLSSCLIPGALVPGQSPGGGRDSSGGQDPARASSRLVERSSPLQVVEPDANDRDLRTTPVVRAVQRAADSVVSIYVVHQLARREPVAEGQGSGVLLDASGLVITNWHVVAPVVMAEPRANYGVRVRLRDGRERPARVLTSSPNRDLALLQLRTEPGDTFKPIEIGRTSDLMIGETVIAIGNPQGHANTVTSGVLSATGRSIQVRAPDGVVRQYTDLLQTDAAINQGNSGGALLDITGRLVGINNAMAMGAENIGFAIPMDVVRSEFQRELVQSQSFAAAPGAPWLGIEVGDRDGALVVTEVAPDGPAAAAGVVVGDVLVGIDRHELRSSIDYLRHFVELEPGSDVRLRLRRDGRNVEAEAQPLLRDQGLVLEAIGTVVDEVRVERNEQLVQRATLAFYRGTNLRRVPLFPAVLRLARIVQGSPAAAIGLEPGDVVLAVVARNAFGERELPITSLRDFARVLEQARGQSLRIAILRGDDDLMGTIEVRADTQAR